MINYKNAIFKKLIHYNDNHLKLRLRYLQELSQKLNKPKETTLKIYLVEQKPQP